MQNVEDWYEDRATQYDTDEEENIYTDLLREERRMLRNARIINCVVVAAIAFFCWSAFIGLPYLVRDIAEALKGFHL